MELADDVGAIRLAILARAHADRTAIIQRSMFRKEEESWTASMR